MRTDWPVSGFLRYQELLIGMSIPHRESREPFEFCRELYLKFH